MTLRIVKKREYNWPITVFFPENGEHVEENFTAVFRRLPANEVQAELNEIQGSDGNTDRIRVFLDKVLVRCEEIEGPEDWSPQEVRNWLLNDISVLTGLFDSYVRSISKIREKNLPAQPTT